MINDNNKLNIAEQKKKLTPDQVDVCFNRGTEPPFSGKYVHNKQDGIYECTVCGLPLFYSATKFDSGTGWPSFWDPVNSANVKYETDTTHEMARTEVSCARCGSHLGHMFEDGPKPTGKRYCINSLSLNFKAKG